MDGLFQTALSNALLVTAAAPIIWAIAKVAGKPALTHALWLVVLLKLIVPPVWLIPLHLSPPRQGEIERVHDPEVYTAIASGIASEPIREAGAAAADPLENWQAVHAAPVLQPTAAPAARGFDIPNWWKTALESLWIAGSLICLVVAVVRIMRFARTLRYAALAPDPVQLRIKLLAERLNLTRAPGVWFIPGTLCPMLWAVGAPARVLIPQSLWDRLNNAQRDAILVHELAHWRRRDHWVRWIELLATVLYWWHPACWWACRELRDAEEQCCDAWVLSTTGDFRHYANALLEAVEFVSSRVERPFNSIAVPALASGLGQFGRLKRRIIMLKNGNISRALSRWGIAATLGLASLVLPLSPTLAQEAPKPEMPAHRIISGTSSIVRDDLIDQPSADNAGDEVRQLREAREQIAHLSKKLDEAEARIKVLQQGASTVRGNWSSATAGGTIGSTAEAAPANGRRFQPTATITADANKLESGYKSESGGLYARVPDLAANSIGTASTDRLDKIEAELRSLLREVESMRRRGNGVSATPWNGQPSLQNR